MKGASYLLLLAAALEMAGMVLLVAPSVCKGSLNAPIPSIFLRISSSPQSFARDFVVTGVESAPSSFKVPAPGPQAQGPIALAKRFH